ncbi:MAG: hypothetical protein Q7R90_02385 [bacterium]|nr:hypothetical protein [bacterium]
MVKDGFGDGPKKSHDVGEPAGFKREGKPNVELPRGETPPNPFAKIAADIKQFLAEREVDQEEIAEEHDALDVACSTKELERILGSFRVTADIPKKSFPLALAAAELYGERLVQEERNDIEPDL